MKKLLSILLAALMLVGCLTAFAGCGDSKKAAEAALEEAATYLENLYKNDAEKTARDYDVAGKIKIGDLEYTVTWTTDADEVTIKESSKSGFYTVDVPDETSEEIPYVLTATIKDADGNTVEVKFNRVVPILEKVTVEADKEIVLALLDGEVKKYVTGMHYLYTQASGNQKWELKLTETEAEALAMTIQENDDGTVSFKAGDQYLFCDANNVKFVAEQGDYTKFVFEVATGGTFIKCAVAAYGTGDAAKPQYLEMYSGYLTCYGMTTDDAKLNLYTFIIDDAKDAAGVIGTISGDNNNQGGDSGNSGNTTTKPVLNAVAPVAGTAYKFAFVQGNKNTAYYLTGVLDGYYMAATTTFADGVDYYVEAVTGGYNFYCMVSGAKKYVNVVVNGTHVNGVYEDTASTVYTYDETLKTLVTTVDGEQYIFGTKKDGSFTTIGPMKASVEPFYAVFVTEAATEEEIEVPGGNEGGNTETALEALTPAVGTAYKLAFIQKNVNNNVYYLTGVLSGYYMASTQTIADGANFFVEETTGGYYLYCMVEGAKKYVNMVVNGTHVNGVYEDTAATVYTYDTTLKTLKATVNDESYIFGTKNDGTFTTLGPMKASVNPFYAQFVASPNPDAGLTPPAGGDDDNNGGGTTPTPEVTLDALTPAVGTAYKFAFIQKNVDNKTFYLTGALSGYYMASTETVADGANFFVEETTGGYYLYCMLAGVKTYVNMVASGTYVNGKYQATASTVYTYDTTLKTLKATVNDASYIFGTKADGTFTTLGPMLADSGCFYAQFVASPNPDAGLTPPAGGDDNTGGGSTTPAGPTGEKFEIAASTGTLAADSLSISWASTNYSIVNQKGSSNTAIRTSDTNHFRVYVGNNFTISANAGKKIAKATVVCQSADYAAAMVAALTTTGVTATADGSNVIITVADAAGVDAVSFTPAKQFRITTIYVEFVA